jgi:hypothetical protein
MVSTAEGMEIDRSDEQSVNAPGSIVESREPGSNVKLKSFRQPMKQHLGIVSTDEGMQID